MHCWYTQTGFLGILANFSIRIHKIYMTNQNRTKKNPQKNFHFGSGTAVAGIRGLDEAENWKIIAIFPPGSMQTARNQGSRILTRDHATVEIPEIGHIVQKSAPLHQIGSDFCFLSVQFWDLQCTDFTAAFFNFFHTTP